jgi:hypothetical protein
MSDIIIRTVFMGKGNDGLVRISDWCRVVTRIGAMMEPFSFNRNKIASSDFQWKEASNRIDEVEGFNPSGPTWGDNTIGGDLVPVSGY